MSLIWERAAVKFSIVRSEAVVFPRYAHIVGTRACFQFTPMFDGKAFIYGGSKHLIEKVGGVLLPWEAARAGREFVQPAREQAGDVKIALCLSTRRYDRCIQSDPVVEVLPGICP